MTGTPKRVIVVGAGLAGLNAARELVGMGHDVTVLEASQRPGGRVLTLRGAFADGVNVEAGALLIPASHNLPRALAAEFGLPLTPLQIKGGSGLFFLQGKPVSNPNSANAIWPVDLTHAEQQLGYSGMWNHYVMPTVGTIGDPDLPTWPPTTVGHLDEITFTQFLASQGASDGATDILRRGYPDTWGDGADTISALLLLRDLAMDPSVIGFWNAMLVEPLVTSAAARDVGVDATPNYYIAGGNDLLPAAMANAPQLTGRIRYGFTLTRIEGDGGSITAVGNGPAGLERVTADRMVCTLPFSVLRAIDLAVPITVHKLQAIQGLPYTSVTRVFIQTRTPLWEAKGLSGFVMSDGPLMFIAAPSSYLTTTHGLLDVYVTGPNARALAALPEAQRIDTVVASLDAIFPGLRGEFEIGVSKCWDQDAGALGGFAWFKPGGLVGMRPEIAVPEGRLHFAGDHTSAVPGWMQGALASGHRAAYEVDAAP